MLGANRELAGAEVETGRRWSAAKSACSTALAAVGADYDFILIDCPPSLTLLTLNGLCAAHGVIVPMQCEYFALEGLTDLVNTIKQVHANLNKDLQIIGLLRVMFDPRITLQQQVSEQLKSHFGDKVFDTVIPRNVRLAEAPSYGLPGVVFDPAAKGSQAFVDLRRRRWCEAAASQCHASCGASRPRLCQLAIDRCHASRARSDGRESPMNAVQRPAPARLAKQRRRPLAEPLGGAAWLPPRRAARLDAPAARRLVGAARGSGAGRDEPVRAGGAQPGLHAGGRLGRAFAQHRTASRPRCWWRRATWSATICAS